MNYHLSDYELNARDPNAIVYRDAYGNITRLTRRDFSSEEEFQKWKSISDADYHKSHNRDHVEEVHTVPLAFFSESSCLSTPSIEDMVIQREEETSHEEAVLRVMNVLSNVLTKTQFRRIWMHVVDGYTQDEIAAIEGVGQRRVCTSIQQAKKTAKNIFRNMLFEGAKIGVFLEYSEGHFSELHES